MTAVLCRAGKALPTILPMYIGQIIRSLREERGWSQEQLALEAGMAPSHVSRIERGERRLPNTRLEAIARALGTTPAAIYARSEGRELPPGDEVAEGDLAAEYSAEAMELRRLFRDLNLEERRLLIDFGKLLLKRRGHRGVA